jgi:hypothetical protein
MAGKPGRSGVGNRGQGRKRGTRNKATIERERIAAEIAARTVMDARTAGRKLAKEVMQDFLPIMAGMAAYYQPTFPGMSAHNPNSNDKEFQRWFELMLDLADKLAPYESPTFKAIAVNLAPTMPVMPALPDPKAIDGNVVPLHDSASLAQAYRRMVTASRRRS